MAVVEVKNLTKRYGRHTAVENLSFSVEQGQIYGFLGPNGAGKSTTMNMMTGYLAPSDGEVLISGHDMMREPEEAKQCIGYLPEVPPVYPDMTVSEYLRFAAELKRIPKADRKEQILKVMELTKVTGVSERLIRNLSKGYRQRVGLAQAILGGPDVIILDEPMVGLDPRQIIEMRDLIRDLGKKHTVILSSHILSEVSAVCDHIMIISGGKLVASDSPEGLQGLIQSSLVLEATVKASLKDLRAVLDTIEAVTGVEEKPCHMPDCVTVLIRTKDNADIREELSMKLYENRLPIMGMNLLEHSLEDIFLELTEREAEASEKKNDSESDAGCIDRDAREGLETHPEEKTKENSRETDEISETDRKEASDTTENSGEKKEENEHDRDL